MLRLLVTLILTSLFITHPVYAGHCTLQEEEQGIDNSYTGKPDQYCAGGIQRYLNLNNCQHRHLQNCPTGTQCEEEYSTDLDIQITRCVPIGAPTATSANQAAGLKQIEDVFKNVIQMVVGLGFIASLIMLIFAGFKYLTSGGEPKAVQAAHHTFSWALLGILFMAIAWLVLQLIKEFTGIDVTKFNIQVLPQ